MAKQLLRATEIGHLHDQVACERWETAASCQRNMSYTHVPKNRSVWRTLGCHASARARSGQYISRECLQQCLGLLKVRRVKALGEPGVDGCQEFPCGVTLPVLLPQPAQDQRRPQF